MPNNIGKILVSCFSIVCTLSSWYRCRSPMTWTMCITLSNPCTRASAESNPVRCMMNNFWRWCRCYLIVSGTARLDISRGGGCSSSNFSLIPCGSSQRVARNLTPLPIPRSPRSGVSTPPWGKCCSLVISSLIARVGRPSSKFVVLPPQSLWLWMGQGGWHPGQ